MAEMIWGFEQLLLDDDTDQFWSVRPELDLEIARKMKAKPQLKSAG
jgi:hypothetical protein